jgi:hypothetical protein
MSGILWYVMSKLYVKDVNGKWRLTDKQEPIVAINQQHLSLEELDARLKRLESIVIDPRK